MDPEVDCSSRVCVDEAEKQKWERPPSSYGSMKSDDEEEEEELCEGSSAPVVATLPEIPAHDVTGLQLVRSASPETLYTMTTQQTKPPGAFIIDTWSVGELDDLEEAGEEDDYDVILADSPEPPPPVEPEELMQIEDEADQPGRPHPEQDVPFLFKIMQTYLSELSAEELIQFRISICSCSTDFAPLRMVDGDILDVVDKMIELVGLDYATRTAIHGLGCIDKITAVEEMGKKCRRVMIRYHLKQYYMRKHLVLYEGVPRPGKQESIRRVYVEPEISTCSYGGINPDHELRSQPTPVQVPSPDTLIGLNKLFRLRKDNGQPVKTVLTTGIPGCGLSVSCAKLAFDWAEGRSYTDMQFVFRLPFYNLASLRKRNCSNSKKMSILEVIEYFHQECAPITYLEDPDSKFLLMMDAYDIYQRPLDWEKAPVITDIKAAADIDVLIVNIIRGTLLPAARIWLLGRRAAVSTIPTQYIDAVTELQGYSEEKKEDFLTRRFHDKSLASKILAHYKRLPTLIILCRQPYYCWMTATVFQNSFRYVGYGEDPPKLTPFYIHYLIIQTNRKLQHYNGQVENHLQWTDEDRRVLMRIGKMALKMLEKNNSLFGEEDVKEFNLKLKDVVCFSGICTELPHVKEKKKYCFIHLTFQEFMAALYVFLVFKLDGRNVLDHHSSLLQLPKLFLPKDQSKAVAGLINSGVVKTLNSPLGHFDMFLRFLCGMLCKENHEDVVRGMNASNPQKVQEGYEEVARLLEKTIESAPAERVANLKECLRELVQKEE